MKCVSPLPLHDDKAVWVRGLLLTLCNGRTLAAARQIDTLAAWSSLGWFLNIHKGFPKNKSDLEPGIIAVKVHVTRTKKYTKLCAWSRETEVVASTCWQAGQHKHSLQKYVEISKMQADLEHCTALCAVLRVSVLCNSTEYRRKCLACFILDFKESDLISCQLFF